MNCQFGLTADFLFWTPRGRAARFGCKMDCQGCTSEANRTCWSLMSRYSSFQAVAQMVVLTAPILQTAANIQSLSFTRPLRMHSNKQRPAASSLTSSPPEPAETQRRSLQRLLPYSLRKKDQFSGREMTSAGFPRSQHSKSTITST